MVVISAKYGRLANRLFLFAHFVAWANEYQLSVANIAIDEYAHYFENLSPDLLCRFPKRGSALPSTRRAREVLYATRLAFGPGERRQHEALHGLLRGSKSRAAKATLRLLLRVRPSIQPIWKKVAWRGWARFVVLEDGEALRLDESFVALADRTPLLLVEGWEFRNDELLFRHREVIRDFFAPVASVRRAVERFIEEVRADCDLLVGVHIRQGDYRIWMDGQFYFPPEAFVEIMKRTRDKYPERNVKFLVCSDEPQCLDRFGGLRVRLGPGDPVQDMHAFAECDFLLGPPSTFTLWASFVGKVPIQFIRNPNDEISLEAARYYGQPEPAESH